MRGDRSKNSSPKASPMVIRLLIEHGADPVGEGTVHDLDVLGWATAWDYVDARPDVVEYLLAHGARYSMPSAVALGAVDAIRELARRSPELNRPMDATNHRRRPLHLAVVKKQAGSLATLLELDADPSQRDRAGLTPLDQAALAGETALARMLIDHGAQIDTPALEWLLRSRPELIRARSERTHHAMLIHHVGPNGIEYFRQTTPASAPEIARLLMAAGADVNGPDGPRH